MSNLVLFMTDLLVKYLRNDHIDRCMKTIKTFKQMKNNIDWTFHYSLETFHYSLEWQTDSAMKESRRHMCRKLQGKSTVSR